MILLIMEEWNLANEVGYVRCCRLLLCTLWHTHMPTHKCMHTHSANTYKLIPVHFTLALCSLLVQYMREAESTSTRDSLVNKTFSPPLAIACLFHRIKEHCLSLFQSETSTACG